MQTTLPIKHYHIVFTLPHQLNRICLHNQRLYYDLLFTAVWNTLRSLGYSHYGVETGAVAVLHTWGQNLSLHPHLHCIVPAAGYTLDGRWKNIGHTGSYLYPVHQLSDTFSNHTLQFVPEEKPDMQAILKKQKGLETRLERLQRLTGVNPCLCPVCKTGRMLIVRELPRIRSPGLFPFKEPYQTT